MRTLAHTRISLTTDLRTAVEKRELLAVYQPQVSMATRKILGFECLLRWHHLQHGWVPPSKMSSEAAPPRVAAVPTLRVPLLRRVGPV